ncbi:hypothetical protein ALC53_07583 [Atta colombica]|uniref:Uncharacterized protein n=1 Tax=Atta colombica TaxID=520822 RepID=A0A195BCJ4_9HYME|nr:hypothetical protein ALC53_07583 [Atta colombica]
MYQSSVFLSIVRSDSRTRVNRRTSRERAGQRSVESRRETVTPRRKCSEIYSASLYRPVGRRRSVNLYIVYTARAANSKRTSARHMRRRRTRGASSDEEEKQPAATSINLLRGMQLRDRRLRPRTAATLRET